MTNTLTLVAYMAALTWLLLLAASLTHVRGWTLDGLKLAFGNRDDLPEPTPIAGRLERTARNTLENFILFSVLVITAHIAGASSAQVAFGAQLFFWARILYVPIYIAGITYVRTAVWAVSIYGLCNIFAAIVGINLA